jgi:antirestriction protein
MKEGLSLVESQKFEKLAEIVDFTRDESFATKLATIKESIKGSVEVKEKIEDEIVVENDWKHLV